MGVQPRNFATLAKTTDLDQSKVNEIIQYIEEAEQQAALDRKRKRKRNNEIKVVLKNVLQEFIDFNYEEAGEDYHKALELNELLKIQKNHDS